MYTIYVILQGPNKSLSSGVNKNAPKWRSIVRLYQNDKFVAGDDSIPPFTYDNGQTWNPDYNAIWKSLQDLLRKYPVASKALKIKA